ncbi:hypothetical protein Acr_05g0011280 [Actinidia rufa]|uniref:Coenzyme Q-binding protein COQ10 START domain-containing protein n=1 Tax=Actinidia rufa TaxID=165716 RepID=A0A7J0END3_9ERIC|nr:hypothetical protein Acr_05g0011280 [Actinidia rufa]
MPTGTNGISKPCAKFGTSGSHHSSSLGFLRPKRIGPALPALRERGDKIQISLFSILTEASCCTAGSSTFAYATTILSYEVIVIPRFNFPAIFLERIIRSDLPVNLQALACRAERNFEGNQNAPTKESFLGTKMIELPIFPSRRIDGAISEKDKLPSGELNESYASLSFGHLSPPSSCDLSRNWGVFGKVFKLDRPCMVDEIHLRRFDGLLENGGVHRCVVASITVKAPVREVWNVLTDYESLPEIVPNLAISKILSRDNNKVRIVQFLIVRLISQEGCKGLLYMVLHAHVVLDLCEHLEQEISFEQVEGDFDFFHGKWVLEQLGNHHTLLKYSVELKMHKNSLLSEAIMEEVIYEDLPSNICAIRDYVEKREGHNSLETNDHTTYSVEQTNSFSKDGYSDSSMLAEKDFDSYDPQSSRQIPRVPGLQRDIEVLKAELLNFISEHGHEGFMPMRKQLREHRRVDIEKAITRMGGFRRIMSLMNLSLAYKHREPKGYWDNLENFQEKISRFQRSWGMDPSFMPSRKSFERVGRYDIDRALEKWGGLHKVSRLLSLKMRHPNRQGNLSKDKKIDYVASNNANGEAKAPSKPCAFDMVAVYFEGTILTHGLLDSFTAFWRRNICHHCNFFMAFLPPCWFPPILLMPPFDAFDFLELCTCPKSPFATVWKWSCWFLSGSWQTTDFLFFSAGRSP